jgi:hypothetical protein
VTTACFIFSRSPEYFNSALQCANNLGNYDDADAFRDQAIETHAKNWRLLQAAAVSLQDGMHQGYIVAGQFHRGYPRGGQAKNVNSYERDRVRALQLMQQAMNEAVADEKDKAAVGQFFIDFSQMPVGGGRGYDNAWRLQYLTDLTKLPDYDEGYYGGYYYGHHGAPVDDKGEPVYYNTPKSWKDAASDGQR